MKNICTQIGLSLLVMMMAISVSFPLKAASNETEINNKNHIIAHVDNQPVTIQEIEDKQINDLRLELHNRLEQKLQMNALKKLAEKYPEFGQRFQPDVSDKAVTEFYLKNNLKSRGSLEELGPQIKAYLQIKAVSSHLDVLYQNAISRGLIVSHLQKPNEFLVHVPVETAYLWEKKGESVMVLEFSDYQCPFCSRIQPTISELRTIYEGRVAFGYRHSPLAFHREADEAAIAVECARDQGKFKPYHDILFKNYQTLQIKELNAYAREAGLTNLKRFNACLTEEKYRSRVENDQKAANEAGIKGTPGFVIGKYDRATGVVAGEIISGAQPRSVFIEVIDKYLEKK